MLAYNLNTLESFAAWNLFQRDLTHLSTKGKHSILKDAGHLFHVDQPQAVIKIIKGVLKEAKNNFDSILCLIDILEDILIILLYK